MITSLVRDVRCGSNIAAVSVTGTARLKLYKGSAIVTGRRSTMSDAVAA